MPVLREVLASFAVHVDDKPLDKLDRKIEQIKGNIKTFATRAATIGAVVGFGTYKLVDAASRAQDVMSALSETFKGSEQQVVEWSRTIGKELQRSEYTLQEAANRFGSFLQPMLRGTDKDIVAMSERLSALAVDLASFYRTSDEEAITRLFSGMSGETEAVRRLGIDLTDEGLNQFNKTTLGDPRQMRQMSQAEKTWVRFMKILADTKEKQGQAARTASQWDNQVKALREEFKTFTTNLGTGLLPIAEKLLTVFRSITNSMMDLTQHSRILTASFITFASWGAYRATLAIIAYRKELMKSAIAMKAFKRDLVAIGIGTGLTLLADDFQVAAEGGRSNFGEFLHVLFNIQEPALFISRVLDRILTTVENIGVAGANAFRFLWRFQTGGWLREKIGLAGDWEPGAGGKYSDWAQSRTDLRTQVFNDRAQNLAQTGNWADFSKAGNQIYEKPQVLSLWKTYRTAALQGGAKPNANDVASGYVSQEAHDAYFASRGGTMPTPGGRGARGKTNVAVNIDMRGVQVNATPEQLTQHLKDGMGPALREAWASVGEEDDGSSAWEEGLL